MLLGGIRKEQSQTLKRNNLISPLGDRSKDDAYGLNDQNKKGLASIKSDNFKMKRRIVDAESNSSRRMKVKTTNAIYCRLSKNSLVKRF